MDVHDETIRSCWRGRVAEWSKALVLGTSPKGRGFESHLCQELFCILKLVGLVQFYVDIDQRNGSGEVAQW
jgi:hypothetical protein